MLHRLIRGSGLRGLAGIPAVRERYIRPLLTVTRADVEAYLQTLEQDYVTDSTNETDAYTRNQIRHQLIPILKQLNPSLEQTSIGMLQVLRSEQDYLRQQTEHCFQQHTTAAGTLSGLLEEHPAMQQRCIIQLLEQFQISYQADRIARLQRLLQTGGKCNLNADYDAVAKNGSLSIQKRMTLPEPVKPKILHEGENQIFSGFFVKARIVSWENMRNPLIVHKKLSKIHLDYDKIRAEIRQVLFPIRKTAWNALPLRLAFPDQTSGVLRLKMIWAVGCHTIPQCGKSLLCMLFRLSYLANRRLTRWTLSPVTRSHRIQTTAVWSPISSMGMAVLR